ncbi:maleylacetoacetate isomerase [Novispirillum sp. DQ9]|uniref:maleylacetoacetate isomerase n=1 Tax=Novispirillum sp. DQ9 TaxID=3398612 RepID=UPI003C7C2130
MKLYSYWRSSTSYRARIALNLKGLDYEIVPVHLLRDGGEHRKADYMALNPQGILPTLVDGATVLTQSLAIVEYIDETHPTPPLLPADAAGRARVRAFSQAVACEIHPLTNLRVLKHLTGVLGHSEDDKLAWYRHWTAEGLRALEEMVAGHPATGTFVHGDAPTLADLCLVPQMYNARRFSIDLTPYPTLVRIDEACRALPAFAQAAPEAQPDAGT